jgi:phenylacetyl-CoA:acceptor oxidoreductase subunit 1
MSTAANPRWGMTVDLNRCVGCQTCTAACKHANDTPPEVQWRRVIDVEQGTFPSVERLFMVVGCQHCEEPPCVPVCPTGATRQRADGLVTMDYDQCIGCAYCAVSCPYQARTIVHEQKGYFGASRTAQEVATSHPERQGVAQKCTFCVDRVDSGLAAGLVPGVDPAASPACAASCIASAIQFGDFNDPESKVSRLSREIPSFQMHAQLGTNPQIRYLYETPAVPGRDSAVEDDERLSDLANPLTGPLQRFWDWRAAMNWCFGGTGSGLATMAVVLWAVGLMPATLMRVSALGAGALMAIGLFCVFLKIGRPMRFWRAVLRPHTSWMTRELYVVVLFYLALAGLLLFTPDDSPGATASATGVCALAFLVCQAMILFKARGIPAWRVHPVPALIVVSGLAEGAGAALLLGALVSAASGAAMATEGGAIVPMVHALAAALVVLVLTHALLWRVHVSRAVEQGIGPLARAEFARIGAVLRGLGHAGPAALGVLVLAGIGPTVLFAALAGALAIAGGFWWKFRLIVRAGYQQGFALPRVPQRGSGHHAAPERRAAPARA